MEAEGRVCILDKFKKLTKIGESVEKEKVTTWNVAEFPYFGSRLD